MAGPVDPPSPPPQPAKAAPKADKAERTVISVDAANEGYVIGFCAADPAVFVQASRRVLASHFVTSENREAWECLLALHRQKLGFAPATIEVKAGAKVAAHIASMIEASRGSERNASWHVDTLLWDVSRVRAAKNTLPLLIEGLKDPSTDPTKVRQLAKAVYTTFDGAEDRKWLLDSDQIVEAQMKDLRERGSRKTYGYGIQSLDWYEKVDANGEPILRMTGGTEPGQVTVITAVSGGGKTTFTANVALGLVGLNRRVLYGAWEMMPGMSLELLACIELGLSRAECRAGRLSDKDLRRIEESMREIGRHVRFIDNPFQRSRHAGEARRTNERNLEILQDHVLESGCDVFIADLWKRCLVDASPEAEEEALYRQQAMAQEGGYHIIMLQQQRLKDVEQRPDKRPTREGVKGSGAWTEVADTMIGLNRPALWKELTDDKLEALILKQRHGTAPLAVEFDWNPDQGRVWNGRSIPYRRPGDVDDEFAPEQPRFGGSRRPKSSSKSSNRREFE
jgi:replicative DNA helicase